MTKGDDFSRFLINCLLKFGTALLELIVKVTHDGLVDPFFFESFGTTLNVRISRHILHSFQIFTL